MVNQHDIDSIPIEWMDGVRTMYYLCLTILTLLELEMSFLWGADFTPHHTFLVDQPIREIHLNAILKP